MKRCGLSLTVLVLAAMSAHAGDDGIKQSIAYVQKLQTESGGFQSQAPKGEEIAPTSHNSGAIRALKYFGGELPKKEACIKFVESCWDDKAGGFSDLPKGKADVFSTAVGLMAVVELKMPVDKYADAASKYLNENAMTFEEIRIAAAGFEAIKKRAPKEFDWWKELGPLQRKDPSFGKGKARDRASLDVTTMRLGAKFDPPDASVPELNTGQRQNGGWGKDDKDKTSDLETTYRVMRCYVMLKAKPGNVEGVRTFVAKCRNADGGYAMTPGQPSSVSGTYFAAIITHWLNAK